MLELATHGQSLAPLINDTKLNLLIRRNEDAEKSLYAPQPFLRVLWSHDSTSSSLWMSCQRATEYAAQAKAIGPDNSLKAELDTLWNDPVLVAASSMLENIWPSLHKTFHPGDGSHGRVAHPHWSTVLPFQQSWQPQLWLDTSNIRGSKVPKQLRHIEKAHPLSLGRPHNCTTAHGFLIHLGCSALTRHSRVSSVSAAFESHQSSNQSNLCV